MLWSFLKCSILYLCCACLVNVPFLEAAGLGKLSVTPFKSESGPISIKVEHEKIEFTMIKPICLDGKYGADKNSVHLNFGSACSMDFSWGANVLYYNQDHIFHREGNIAVVIDLIGRTISFNGFKKVIHNKDQEKTPEFPCASKIEGKATAVTVRGSAMCNIDILFMNPLASPKLSSKTTSPTLKKAGTVFDLGVGGWIGIGVGILVLVVLVAFLIFWFVFRPWYRRRQSEKQATTVKPSTFDDVPMNTPISCVVAENKAINDLKEVTAISAYNANDGPKEVTAISGEFPKDRIRNKTTNISMSKSGDKLPSPKVVQPKVQLEEIHPRIFPLDKNQQLIADGRRVGKHENPTMDDVKSDWGTQDTKEKSRDLTLAQAKKNKIFVSSVSDD